MSSPTPVILITAGSAGLGAAAAKVFATAGYHVAINYSSNAERAQSLVAELDKLSPLTSSSSPKFIAIRADVSDKASISSLVNEATSAFGRLDVVFSNHGWTSITKFKELDDNVDEEMWDRCWGMNVKSHLWLMHACRKWLDESEGAFVTTASIAGIKPGGSSVAYSVTKAAQIHLVKSLATMVAPKIRVNSVSPGLLLTEWGLKFSQEKIDAALAKTQLKRFATVEDCAEQVLCFAKSRSTTGVNIIIDGGAAI